MEAVGVVQRRSTNNPRAGTPLQGTLLPLQGNAERVGSVQPGEEKAVGRPSCSLPVPEGPARKLERDFLQGQVVIGQGVMASS